MNLLDLVRPAASRLTRRRPSRRSLNALDDALEPRLLLAAVTMTDQEQLMLELINRARANPGAEAARQGIDLNAGLAPGTISNTPKQPLAPHQSLITASGAHALDMLNRDYFDHTTQGTLNGPPQRAQANGYPTSSVGENIAWGGTTGALDQNQAVFDRHRGLFLSTGHRTNMMHIPYEEIGAGVRYGQYTTQGTTYNAAMVVVNFGIRSVNPFITGVVYTDGDDDNFYDIGEAVRSGTVRATNLATGTVYSETIGNSGGYGFIVPAGNYSVTASYTIGGQPRLSTKPVTVNTDNVKVDFDSTDPSAVSLTITESVTALNESGANSSPVFQVSRDGDLGVAVNVALTSSDTTEVTVPATVTIPAGQASVSFTVTAINDGIIDGTQPVTITASFNPYAADTSALTVADRNWPVLPTAIQTVTTARPTFNWTGVSNAATYQVYVNNVTTGQTQVINQSGIAASSYVSPIDLPIGDYNVWVRGFTLTGLASVWSPSATWKVRTLTTVLNSGRTERSRSFRIEWNPVPGASTYDVWINRLTSNTSQYYRNEAVIGTSITVSDFAIGQYGIWVRSRNLAGHLTGWSPLGIVYVNLAVQNVGVSADDLTANPALTWGALAGAVRYDVWVDNLTTGQTQVIRNTNVPTNTLTLGALTPGSYRAYVRGFDARNLQQGWSAPFNFEYSGPPRLLSPTGSANSGTPLFTWTTVSGAVRYELVIADELLTPLHTESALTGTAWSPTAPLSAGSYRAWIRAFASDDTPTVTSAVISFSVAAAEPVAPNDGLSPELDLFFAKLDLFADDIEGGDRHPVAPAAVVVVDLPAERREREPAGRAELSAARRLESEAESTSEGSTAVQPS